MTDFEKLLVSGGDERLDVNELGLNKYHLNPTITEKVFNRGSCTCSFLTPDAKNQAFKLYQEFQNNPNYSALYSKLSERIKKGLDNSKNNFEVYIAPSGSDLCYFPLLFMAGINPNKPIMNIVTCPEELGSGSVLAYQGKFFSQRTQIEEVEIGEVINPKLDIDFKSYPARDRDGKILNHKLKLLADIDAYSETHSLLANLVIGSKSGIEDNISIIEETSHLNVTWVVDICQLRVSKTLIQKLLSLNCLLLITGSKFYQSPPFCGAMIVPEKIESKLKSIKPEAWVCDGFNRVFSAYDFPEDSAFKPYFNNIPNLGLLMRWEAGIFEFEALSKLDENEVNNVISNWNNTIGNFLREESDVFELMQDQNITNKSIISFKIKRDGQYLEQKELREIHKKISLHGHEYFPKYKHLAIGQPVAYASGSFLRLALGSYSVRRLISNNQDFTDDLTLIDVISTIVNERK